MPEFTPRQLRFVDELLIDDNATQAAIRAGYSAKTAQEQSARLLALPHIIEAVAKARAERSERTKIDADYVLRQAVKLHERCMQEIDPKVNRRGEQITDENGRPVFVFDASAAAKSLELIGKHVGVQAFREKVEVAGDPDNPLHTITTIRLVAGDGS